MSDRQSTDTPGVTILPPFVFLIGLVGGYLIQWALPFPILPPVFDVAIRGAGVIVILVGAWLMFTALAVFQRAGTPASPHETSKALAFDGPYRFTRNPMYLGMALVLAGFAFIGNALWPLLALIPVIWWIQTQVIHREEAYLSAKFGQPYVDFTHRVRRWL